MKAYRVVATLTLTGTGKPVVEELQVNLADGMDPDQAAEAQLVDLGYTDGEITRARFENVAVD